MPIPKKKRWGLRIAATCVALLIALSLFYKSSVDGCYLVSSPQGQGHEFIFFTNGNVFACVDNHPMPSCVVWLGPYELEPGTGWVWTLRKLNRRILCDPHLLYMRFTAIDGINSLATDPFEWRDPFFWICNRTISGTNFINASKHLTNSVE